jgi:CHAD domain-containing protein
VAFEGRALDLILAGEDGPVALTLLRGTLRTIGRELAACRLLLSGAEPAVLSLALALAEEAGASVTRASLAAEALALATGTLPALRRHGAPSVAADATVADAFAEAVGHLADVILQLAPAAADGTDGPETVHHMRVAVRRLRSALTVFRRAVACPAIEAAELGLKALGARLGPTRDWDVFATETGPRAAAAFPGDKRLERLLAATERRRRAHQAALGAFLRGPEFRRLGVLLAWIAAGRSWHDSIGEAEREAIAAPLTEFAARVLNRRLKRVAAAGAGLDGLAPELLHDVRLLAKRLRYAAEIFAPLWPGKATRRFLERLAALQQELGMLNDGAVAAGLLDELAGAGGRQAFAAGLVLGFVGAGAGGHRAKIARAWEKFRRQEPFWT